MKTCCPTCGQPIESPADPVADLRAWCVEQGLLILAGDRVHEDAAARILALSEGTLRNWRSYGRELPYQQAGGKRGRVTYRLADLANYRDGIPK